MSTVLIGSVLMGLVFGFAFGLIDAEDEPRFGTHPKFHRLERLMVVLGAGVGAAVGLLTHLWRLPDKGAFDRLDQDMELYGGF
jgi:hypothetical protein